MVNNRFGSRAKCLVSLFVRRLILPRGNLKSGSRRALPNRGNGRWQVTEFWVPAAILGRSWGTAASLVCFDVAMDLWIDVLAELNCVVIGLEVSVQLRVWTRRGAGSVVLDVVRVDEYSWSTEY